MLSLLYRFLRNSNLMFLAAFLLGLVLGGYASLLKVYILPALVFIMTLSTTQITLSELTHFRNYLRDILFVFVINYVFLSGLILLANYLLIRDPDLYVGFVVMAAIPPAVGKIDPLKLFSVLIQLILVPFIASRLLLKWKFFHRVKGNMNIFVNLGFFIVIYIVIGMNRWTFLSHFEILALVSSIAFLRTFVSGHLVDLFARLAGINRERRMSYVLFGSFKNLGVAASIAIILFNERAAIPSAVTIPFELIFFVWFNYYQNRWG
jgi:BASS family bile acid:Na+ symporter